MTIRCLLADDSLLIRSGVEAILHLESDISVIGTAGSFDELMESVTRLQPDVVISDIRMPPTLTDEGIRAAVDLRSSHPEIAVLVLSQFAQPDFLQQVLAGGSGRRGYLLKDNLATAGELVTAVRLVASGGSFVDTAVVNLLVAQQSSRPSSPLERLTAREREILSLLATGRSNQAIAGALFIGHRAVEKHINAIFAKLDLLEDADTNRRVQAVLLFLDSASAANN